MYRLLTSAVKAAALAGTLSASLLILPLLGQDKPRQLKPEQRLDEATEVFSDIMAAPDKGIPQDLLDQSHCVVIVPGLKKGAFILGGEYGKGFLTCRDRSQKGWSAPGAVRIEGGSIGIQAGGSESDVILLVMNQRGEDRLLSSKFTLGAEGEVAAGPVGRTANAQTDAKFTAEILSWSRARGVFAGLSLKGATLRQDLEANQALYGSKLENREIVTQRTKPPQPAAKLLDVLNRYSPV